MGKKEEDILNGIRQLSDKPAESFPAEVTENYPDKDYIDVTTHDGTMYPEVRKRSNIDGKKGIVITPVKKSFVIVTRIQGSNSLFMSMVSEIESVKITLENHEIKLDKDGLAINMSSGKYDIKNDQENLKSLISDLISEIEKITVTTGTGPSGTPINIVQLQQIGQRVTKLFK